MNVSAGAGCVCNNYGNLYNRISAGSCQDLKNWNLLQSGHALGIMTVAGNFSNADAIFVGVWLCCLLPYHRNNFVENQVRAVEMGNLFNTQNKSLPRRSSKALKGQFLCCYCVCSYLYSQLRCVRTFCKCSRVFAVQIVANVMAWAMYVGQAQNN